VVAGTVSTDSSIRVRVDAVGDDTALAGIQRLVDDAQSSRSRAQTLADRAAAALFYLATAAAAITFLTWVALGELDEGVTRAVTVLVIACPHALGLAIPLVISISTATAAQAGILVKDRRAVEAMRTVDTVLFDKTGTLTRGNHVVTDLAAVGGDGEADRVLAVAAAAERDSEHPIARAIVASASERRLNVPDATNTEAVTGRGVTATVEGDEVAVGGPAMLDHLGLDQPSGLAEDVARWQDRGGAVLYVVRDQEVVGALTVADEIRPESRAAIDELHQRGRRVVLITGDARHVADGVARELGIDEVRAEVLPEDKDGEVADLQSQRRAVAKVGGGGNDAPALARADVGLAIGAGTDVAIESAGVVLASDDPRSVVRVIELSEASYRKMIENLVWATAYNGLSVPCAAGALAVAGITFPPASAAVARCLSTCSVAGNAQLLRRLGLRAGRG
jgi:Cu2+-exporting ATPase